MAIGHTVKGNLPPPLQERKERLRLAALKNGTAQGGGMLGFSVGYYLTGDQDTIRISILHVLPPNLNVLW